MTRRSDFDSRLNRPTRLKELVRFRGNKVLGEPVFCISCGKQDGYVPVELPPGVIDLCGSCEKKFGVPTEMTNADEKYGFTERNQP